MAPQRKTPRPRLVQPASAGAAVGSTPAAEPTAAVYATPDAVVAALVAAPRYLSPAIALCQELQDTYQPEDILRLEPRIAEAIALTEQETRITLAAAAALRACSPVPATAVPDGF